MSFTLSRENVVVFSFHQSFASGMPGLVPIAVKQRPVAIGRLPERVPLSFADWVGALFLLASLRRSVLRTIDAGSSSYSFRYIHPFVARQVSGANVYRAQFGSGAAASIRMVGFRTVGGVAGVVI